jgi:hypothetical protein
MIRNVTLATLFAVASFVSVGAKAEEHAPGTIQGTHIELRTIDHGFAGTINEWLVVGNFDHGTFGSDLTLRNNTTVVNARFADINSELGGTLAHTKSTGDAQETKVVFVKAQRAAPQLEFTINGQQVLVTIASEDFQNNHFINPTYTTTLNGEAITFKLTGEACYGYSAHLNMMILGALAHTL